MSRILRTPSLWVALCITALLGVATEPFLRGRVPGAVAAQCSPVAPRTAEVRAAMDEAYARYRGDTSGKNADYIPVLAKVDPNLFGIAIVSTSQPTSRST